MTTRQNRSQNATTEQNTAEHRTQNAEHSRTQNTEHRTQNTKHNKTTRQHRTQNATTEQNTAEHRTQNTEHRKQCKTEHRTQQNTKLHDRTEQDKACQGTTGHVKGLAAQFRTQARHLLLGHAGLQHPVAPQPSGPDKYVWINLSDPA